MAVGDFVLSFCHFAHLVLIVVVVVVVASVGAVNAATMTIVPVSMARRLKSVPSSLSNVGKQTLCWDPGKHPPPSKNSKHMVYLTRYELYYCLLPLISLRCRLFFGQKRSPFVRPPGVSVRSAVERRNIVCHEGPLVVPLPSWWDELSPFSSVSLASLLFQSVALVQLALFTTLRVV